MRLAEQHKELLRLKKEIDRRLLAGTSFEKMKELMLYLAQDKAYHKLKSSENQMIMLESFFNIWLKEKKELPPLGIETDIFYQISCLDDVERKYQRIKYCGLRIENAVWDEYIRQALGWLVEDKVSGIAIGKIIVAETQKREENLLYIAGYLGETGDMLNALLLLRYADEALPGKVKLLLKEAENG